MIYLNKKGINTTLKEFQLWWKEDKKNRVIIPHNAWKKIKDADFIKIMILFDNTVHMLIDYEEILDIFHKSDNSFGEFLYERYFKKEETKMTNTISGYVDVSSCSTCDVTGRVNTNCNTLSTTAPGYYYAYDSSAIKDLQKEVETLKKEIKGEKKTMNLNLNFGTCEKDNIRMSMYGIAVKNAANEWVSYDVKTGNIINVDIFNFDGGKYLFKMPVAFKDIEKGDIIIHNKVPMFVSQVENNKIFAIDPVAGEEKCVLLTKNMFGFDFATKVVSLFDMGNAVAPSKDSPFGNMWPLMLADDNIDPVMLMMMSGNIKDMDPMMMYLLMSKDNNKDIGLLLAMMNSKK